MRTKRNLFGVVALIACNNSALSQSYQETVNFILLGNKQLSERQFGLGGFVEHKISIVSVNQRDCTAEIKHEAAGMGVSMIAGSGGIEMKIKIHFNAISHYQPEINSVQGVPANYDVTFDGNGKPIFLGTSRISGRTEEINCTTNCSITLPPDLDLTRYDKAIDYLYEKFCTADQSAF